ncbi:MAG TPA: MFS transporter, partial [Candidatus Limnocylindrales bacterium]|nr:MFS transporter [Candidatus Limnocylindrales bacterium]
QVIVVGITIALNGLDGFDVLSISFASPGIAEEWGIDRAALGIVLSMELIGMAIGSILLGGVADKIGRRPTILGCLAMMTFGMLMATTVGSVVELSIWRVVTGLGIGGMLAAITAMVAEFSNDRRRHLSVSLMAIGYPVGAVVGGIVVAQLLRSNDWRAVFYFGAAATATLVPIVFFLMPESVHWLARKQPNGALGAINRALARMGHQAVDTLPVVSADVRGRSVADIFAPGLAATTAIVTLAYFLHITTFYFIIKWIPKIVVDLGFAASSAAGIVVWTNVGGALGGGLFGLLTQRYGVKPLTIGMLVLSTVMVTVFGRTPPDLQRLSLICAAAGFCTNAGIVGLYAIIAQAFPTHVRAFGTGFAIGTGRGGSVLAPIAAGFLFAAGYSLQTVALMMALGSLAAAGILLLLRFESGQQTARGERRVSTTAIPAAGRAQ